MDAYKNIIFEKEKSPLDLKLISLMDEEIKSVFNFCLENGIFFLN